MRQFKFRAWDEDSEVMLYSDKEHEMEIWGFEGGKMKAWVVEERYGVHSHTDPPEPPETIAVERKPIMQNTGLKDKTGKEIYEGDVVAAYYQKKDKNGEWVDDETRISGIAEVKWGVSHVGGNDYEYDFDIIGPYVETGYLYSKMIDGDVKVIGNIYENPKFMGR